MPENERTTHTAGRDAELSTEIALTVAEAVGVDPLELDPLYDVVDPEVVQELLETPGISEGSSITFAYAGRQVTVDGEGTIVVEAPSKHT